VDLHLAEKRDARYMEIIGRYERAEVDRFPQMLGELVLALEGTRRDVLGQIFMATALGNHWKGQFFTPCEVAYLMASLAQGDAVDTIERQGFSTLQEPAIGAGAMVIASAEALHDVGINPQQSLHVTGIDVDATACHMAYLQLALLHIPAIILHANALSDQAPRGHWVTPAHVLGLWDSWLRRQRERQAAAHPVPVPLPEPVLVRHRAAVVSQRIEQDAQQSVFG
jgi:type I restriction-modification system DNA methylase subunit